MGCDYYLVTTLEIQTKSGEEYHELSREKGYYPDCHCDLDVNECGCSRLIEIKNKTLILFQNEKYYVPEGRISFYTDILEQFYRNQYNLYPSQGSTSHVKKLLEQQYVTGKIKEVLKITRVIHKYDR